MQDSIREKLTMDANLMDSEVRGITMDVFWKESGITESLNDARMWEDSVVATQIAV
jgi:hypothetical protein